MTIKSGVISVRNGKLPAMKITEPYSPMRTEITPLLIVIKLEQYDYLGAAALGLVMLLVSFVMLLSINAINGWRIRRMAGRR